MAQNQRAWLTGDTLSGNRERILVIPGDINFLMAVNGALLPLIYAENWEQHGTVTPEDAAAAMQTMYLNYLVSEPTVTNGDSEITIFPGNMTVVLGNPIVNTINANARQNFVSQQSPNINGNSRQAFRYMQAGNWEFRLTAVTQSAGCSLTMQIIASDGTIITLTAANLRTAATVFNTVFSRTFTLPSSGLTQLFFGVSAGSTGGFADLLQLVEMWRT